MKKKIVFLIISIFCFVACEKKEFVILIEQPTDINLDNLELRLVLDNDKNNHFITKLKYSDVTPRFINTTFLINEKEEHNLSVFIDEKEIIYKLYYPEDKYIIISPFYKENNINVGILKKNKKFNLH